MSDFVTLICPACGGKLDISSSTASLICQQCGAEHIVRREAGNILLESFAQCPICHRNDKARKVSGVVSSHTVNMDGATIEKRHYTDKDGHSYTTTERVPFTGSQASDLAKRLAPPPKPARANSGSGSGCGTIIHSVLAMVFYIYGAMFVIGVLMAILVSMAMLVSLSVIHGGIIVGVIMGLLALVLIVVGRNFVVKQWKKESLRKAEIKAEKDKKEQELLAKEQELLARETVLWNKAMEKWGRLYYCERDDTVFDPINKLYASANNVLKFIYQNN